MTAQHRNLDGGKINMENSMPLISVIVPIYNTEKYLSECLDSIIAQTVSDMEIICVDDGSTDKCAEILQQYRQKDERIKIISRTNGGLSAARNDALEIARGEYLAFVDSDDCVADNFLEKLLAAIMESDSDICGCDFQKMKNDKNPVRFKSGGKMKIYDDALSVLLNRRNFIHFSVWNKLYRRKVIGNMRFVEGIYFEDWVFNCCVFSKAKTFCWLSDKLYGYRLSENSIMRSPFSLKKIHDYAVGIEFVYNYFMNNAPEKWKIVRRTRIARTVKMLMNASRRTKNAIIGGQAAETLRRLYADKFIGFAGLSPLNKLKLWWFLHRK